MKLCVVFCRHLRYPKTFLKIQQLSLVLTSTRRPSQIVIVHTFPNIILTLKSFSKGDETVRVDEEKQTVKQLKGAVKCSLAQLLDINVPSIIKIII